jgi:hypothetical protein
MHISPISYRNNPQAFEVQEKLQETAPQVAFTGSERPPHGSLSWGRRIVAATMLGLATLFGAGTVMGQNTTKTDSTLLAENKPSTKPVVFVQESFDIGKDQKLTVAAINTKGDKSGFNAILANLYDYTDLKSTKWWVTSLTEPAEGSHLKPWVCFAKLGDNNAKPLLVDDANVVKYVRGLIEDTRNLSPADIRKAGQAVVAVLK